MKNLFTSEELKSYTQRAYECAKAHGFRSPELRDEHDMWLIISELAEATEADRKGWYHYKKSFHNEMEGREIWKPVPGWENDYEVSTLGRVRSKDLLVWNGITYYKKRGKVLSPGLSKTGYYTVCLRGKTQKVSRLVASAFLEKDDDSFVVNHIDGNKANNNVNNLEWVSPASNNRHALITGLRNPKSKLTYEQKVEIAFLHKLGLAYSTIYKHNNYGVSESAIQRVCNEYQRYTESFEMELADVCIRIFDFCGARNLNLYVGIQKAENMYEGYHFTYSTSADVCSDFYRAVTGVTYAFRSDTLRAVGYLFDYICTIAEDNFIDLRWYIEQKMRYNELRPYKNGKLY